MTKKRFSSAIEFLLILFLFNGYGNWTRTVGTPQNGAQKINALAIGTDGRDTSGRTRCVFAGTDNGVYLSIDSGSSWTFFNGSPTRVSSLTDNVEAGTSDGTLYTCSGVSWSLHATYSFQSIYGLQYLLGTNSWLFGTPNGVWCSFQGQLSSNPIGLSSRKVNAIAAVYTGLTPPSTFNYDVFSATDSGVFFASYKPQIPLPSATWTSRNNGLTTLHVNALTIDIQHTQYLFAGTDKGPFLSQNEGALWVPFNEGLTEDNVTAMIFTYGLSPYIYAATFTNNVATIWRRPLSDITSTVIAKDNRFANDNFDVMVNNRTLTYALLRISDVKIRIFDLNGKLVYSSQLRGQTPGTHSLPLASERLSSGNYILDFKAGPYMIRKAIAVMR